MIRVAEDTVEVSGPMTLALASDLLTEGCAALGQGEVVFDLAAVTDVDSSSIAVIFGWLRKAREQGHSIRIAHPPKDLLNLAEVYDVTSMLPLA